MIDLAHNFLTYSIKHKNGRDNKHAAKFQRKKAEEAERQESAATAKVILYSPHHLASLETAESFDMFLLDINEVHCN